MPALFDHVLNTFAAMQKRATKHTVDEGGEPIEILVYEGFLTKLVTEELHLSVPYYTSVMRKLVSMGCVVQLKRGGGNAKSQWELRVQPTEELFRSTLAKKKKKQAPTDAKVKTLETLIDQINSRVQKIEDLLQNIIDEETRKSA